MNKRSEDKIIDFICSIYNNITFCIEGDNYKILSVKINRNKRGIKSILCYTFYTSNGYMYKNKGVPAMPYVLFQLIDRCEVIGYNDKINAISIQLWFKKPLTKKDIQNLDPVLSIPMKKP